MYTEPKSYVRQKHTQLIKYVLSVTYQFLPRQQHSLCELCSVVGTNKAIEATSFLLIIHDLST